ncbi:probable manganese-transporting ATPase PDR2 [Tanacetum coccineum]
MVTRLTHLLGCSIGRDKDCILVSFVRSSNNPKNCKSSLLGDWHMINVALTRTKVDICCFDKTGTLTSDDMEFSRVGGLRDDMDLTTDTKRVPTRTLEIIASYHGMVSMHSKLVFNCPIREDSATVLSELKKISHYLCEWVSPDEMEIVTYSEEMVEALAEGHDLCIGGDCFEMLMQTCAFVKVIPFVKAHVGLALLNDKPSVATMSEAKTNFSSITVGESMTPAEVQMQKLKQMMDKVNKGDDGWSAPLVKLGDTSMASSFSVRHASVSPTTDIIRQGRTTLVTTLQMFMILGLNCLATAYLMSVMHLDGVKLGDVQATVSGLFTAVFFLFISHAVHCRNCVERPHANIFCFYVFLSLMGQFALHMLFFISSVKEAEKHMPDECIDPATEFESNWLTLSNRGDANVPKTITKPFTHIEGWEGSFFYIENKRWISRDAFSVVFGLSLTRVTTLPSKSLPYHEPSIAIIVSASVVDRSIGTNNPHLEFLVLRLVLKEKKWVNYDKTLATLRSKDRVVVVAKVVPHIAIKLVRSDEMGLRVARLVKTALVHGRCTAFEEVAALKEPFKLEKMPGHRPFLKKEFDQAGDNVATASYPFLAEAIANPYTPLEVLLSKNPRSIRSKSAPSQSKSKLSSSKVANPDS